MDLCNALAEILTALAGNCSVESKGLGRSPSRFMRKRSTAAQHFPEIGPDDLPRHIASHSLTVARVIARLARHDGEWRGKPLEPIVAALVHDVGMLKMPRELLGQTRPLTDEERRTMEAHALLGAEMASRITPNAIWLMEAAGQHHERLDGTGYPGGCASCKSSP